MLSCHKPGTQHAPGAMLNVSLLALTWVAQHAAAVILADWYHNSTTTTETCYALCCLLDCTAAARGCRCRVLLQGTNRLHAYPDTGKAGLLQHTSMLPSDSSKDTGSAGLTCPTMNLSRRSTTCRGVNSESVIASCRRSNAAMSTCAATASCRHNEHACRRRQASGQLQGDSKACCPRCMLEVRTATMQSG